MSLTNSATSSGDYGEASPLARTIMVLQKQCMDTKELQGYLDQVRADLNGQCDPKIRQLLDSLSGELNHCSHLLSERIGSLSSAPALYRPDQSPSHSSWRLFSGDTSDCREQLESLLSAYAHYVRTTWDSITVLTRIGDVASVGALNLILAATEKGLWFIEIYLEGLALRMDCRRLPEWPGMD